MAMSVEYGISANKKCRLCLRKTAAYINLFEGNYQEMIHELTSLEISENDGYPKSACISCIDEIQQATKTRRRILECHKKLEQQNCPRKEINHPEVIMLSDDSEDIGVDDDDLEEILTYSEVEGFDDLMIKTELTEEINDGNYDMGMKEEEMQEKADDLEELPTQNFSKSLYNPRKRDRRSKTDRPIRSDVNFTCEECGENFSNNRYAFRLHKMKHKKSACKICGIVIRSDNLAKHLEGHTSGPRICDLCGITCKNVESLRGHIFYMHRTAADEHKCDHCPRSFRMKYKLEEHRNKEHIGLKNHKCTVCQKTFFTSREMKSHINMTHKKLRPHLCDYCQKGFSSKYALKTHIRQHTNEAPYKCSICAEGFRQNISLRTHMKSKHNIEEDKKFPCEFCDKSFVSYFALKVHLRLHSDNNYKCDECQEYFHQKIYLLNHLKKVHDMDESMVDLQKYRTYDFVKEENNRNETGNMNVKESA